MALKTKTTFGRAQAALVAALLSAAVALPSEAWAAKTTSVANPEYEAALEELNRITDAYGALAEEQDATLTELEAVRKKIAENETQKEGVEQDVAESKAKLKEKQDVLAGHVSAEYKSGGVSLASIVFSSSSFEDLISRIHYHSIICAAEVDKINEVNAARTELEKRQAELDKIEQSLEQEEQDLETLYGEQRERTEAMYEQQLAAHELVESLPAEIQQTVEEEAEELIPDAEPVATDDGEQQATEEDAQAEDEKTEADTTKEQGDQPADKENAAKEETSQTSDKADTTKTEDTSKKQSTSSDTKKKDASKETAKTETSSKKETTPEPEPATPKQRKTSAGTQQAVLDSAYATSGTEALNNGWGCAGWVYTVFRNSGVYDKKPTCAAWYYNNWCYSSDKSDLQPGMVIAVSTWTGTAAGKRYGHVGIYIGNNTVRHLSAGAVRETSVNSWIRTYGTTVTPRWGWNGGKVLS